MLLLRVPVRCTVQLLCTSMDRSIGRRVKLDSIIVPAGETCVSKPLNLTGSLFLAE